MMLITGTLAVTVLDCRLRLKDALSVAARSKACLI